MSIVGVELSKLSWLREVATGDPWWSQSGHAFSFRAIVFFSGDEPTWHGYFYTAVLSVSAVLAATCDSQYWYRMTQLGLGVRTALSSSIYRKSLRLSNKARGSFTGTEETRCSD